MSQSTPSSSPSTERTNYLSSDDEDGNSDEEVDKEDMDPTYLAGLVAHVSHLLQLTNRLLTPRRSISRMKTGQLKQLFL